MGLPLHEQETIIRFNQEEQTMIIYTAYPPMMRKLSECSEYTKVREDRMDGKVIAMIFRADKKLLTLRSKKVVGRKKTNEERERAKEYLQKARFCQRNQSVRKEMIF